MRWRNIVGLLALFVVSNAQSEGAGSRLRWDDRNSRDQWTPSDNLIDIDLETERNNAVDQPWEDEEVSGSGSGGILTDDEDMVSSGSGSGDRPAGPTETDRPPKANAGRDVVVDDPRKPVYLCGNASTDDRGIVSYEWVKNTVHLDAEMQNTRSMCVKLRELQIGDYTFTLRVTDTVGQVSTDQIHVKVTEAATTPSPLSACQQLREASKHLFSNFIPRCTAAGDYDSLQCRGDKSTGICWCVDLSGREIPGTASSPQAPDCQDGSNLPPCVYRLVQLSRRGSGSLLGSFRPKCTLEGDFERRQCSGQQCFCVHPKSGVKKPGTEVFLPDDPNCDGKPDMDRTTPVIGIRKDDKTMKPVLKTTPVPGEEEDRVNINIDKEPDSGEDTQTEAPVSNETGDDNTVAKEPNMSAAHMISQPGILAAIIGGSVVLLLCAILLVMFIVYRMRKKDEGSYALEEPKKMPNYSYQRAPDKEFYA